MPIAFQILNVATTESPQYVTVLYTIVTFVLYGVQLTLANVAIMVLYKQHKKFSGTKVVRYFT